MSLAKKCDRCGKLYEYYGLLDAPENVITGLIFITAEDEIKDSHEIKDLCPDCSTKFVTWFSKGILQQLARNH